MLLSLRRDLADQLVRPLWELVAAGDEAAMAQLEEMLTPLEREEKKCQP